MIVKRSTIITWIWALLFGMLITAVAVGMAQLKRGEYHFWKDFASMWWMPIPCSVLIMFKELMESSRRGFKSWKEMISPYEKIELDTHGISRRGIYFRNYETAYFLSKSWEELALSTGKWNDWGGFVFSCPPETDGESKWIKFFKVNFFLANSKQLMEFAVKHIPKENISDWTLLRLKKMGIYT